MKKSRVYQNWVQAIGSISEIVLFLSGFFLGKELFITALILLSIRVLGKITISELMYRRMQYVFREEHGGKEHGAKCGDT